ncbi:MAG: hypothetical protein KGL39_06275 [Patescibacteria group bacterium]|nr:hypothetical protein [Patescibacteria group bacterium]
MKQLWAGITCDDRGKERIDMLEIDDGWGGWGENKRPTLALFTSRERARQQYEKVAKVEVRIVSKKK